MINILMVTREPFPTFRADVFTLFGKYLPRYGIKTSIVASASSSKDVSADWPNNLYLSFSDDSILGRACRNLEKVKHITLAAKSNDAIQVRDQAFWALWGVIVSKIYKKRFFYWMSWPFAEDDLLKFKYSIANVSKIRRCLLYLRGVLQKITLRYLVFPNSSHIFVQSQAMKDWLIKKYGVSCGSATPVPMGVDLELIGQFRNADKKESDDIVIAYLGVANPVRMGAIFFEVVVELLEKYENVNFLIVGAGETDSVTEWFQSEIQRIGMEDRFRITGWVSTAEAWRYLAEADIGINFLSRNILLDTSSPTKILEYAALGLPSVCTDVPDQKQSLNYLGCGICVEYDKEQLVTAMSRLIEDKDLRNRMAERGAERISEYRSYMNISKDLSNVYKYIFAVEDKVY